MEVTRGGGPKSSHFTVEGGRFESSLGTPVGTEVRKRV